MTESFDRRQHRFPESRYFEDLAIGERTVRAVTHLDVSRDQCRRAADLLAQVIERR